MTETKRIKEPYNIPSLNTILAAMDGDLQAMNELIHFYQPYIRSLAVRKRKNEYEGTYETVDEQWCGQLEVKLIMSVLKFKIL